MAQNIYDDPRFFEGYSQLPRSTLGLDGAPEWPALRAMLPDLRGLRVVDLGCGYGWFCRFAREAGAGTVLGLDVSTKMLERACSWPGADVPSVDDNPGGLAYRQADLERLDLPVESFDLAYSSLAFHYVENLRGLLEQVYRALTPAGRLVFSIEHPVFMAPREPGWTFTADGHRQWPVDSYQLEGPRITNWLADGVIKQHRTLGTLINHLIGAGFSIAQVNEWGPSPEDLAVRPELIEEIERPMMLLVAADHR
jgi:SAM-dependent methyltransferase